MAARLDGCSYSTPVVDAGVEDADLIAREVIGGEDLQMTEAAVDGVFAKTVRHKGEVAAGQEQSGHASAHHQQRHQSAAAVTKDVAKGE
jgi:hypothetical protein